MLIFFASENQEEKEDEEKEAEGHEELGMQVTGDAQEGMNNF